MSYTHERDKMHSIHPQLGKFDFVVAKMKREQALAKGIGSKEWIEFATMMFEQFPFIYNTCLLMNDEAKSLRKDAKRYRWIAEHSNAGAKSNGMVLNQKLLNGHRHRNRMMYSFLISASDLGESVDLPLDEAIDREMDAE